MHNLLYVLLALLVFLFIITVHEFGHFITAKMFKVKVPEFSIGFGPKLMRKRKGETQYSLGLIPVGGYVKLEGEDEASSDERAFCNKPVWQRIIIVLAGAFLNLVTGFIVYVALFARLTTVPTMIVESAVPGTPAYGNILPQDKIIAINGNKVWYFKDFRFILSTINKEKEVKITLVRDNKKEIVNILPVYDEEDQAYEIGITMKVEKPGFLTMIKYGFYETFFIIKLIFYSLFMLISGGASFKDMSGPVGTVNIMAQAAKSGISSFMSLFAMLTVNIGIFNLLPFPALDGGRAFFMFIEILRGKPINPEKEGKVHFIGIVLLMLLMFAVTISDIGTIISGIKK